MLPATPQSGIELIKKMLALNPYFRTNFEECIKSPYFDQIRSSKKEEIEPPTIFDLGFEDKTDAEMSFKQLKELYMKEIKEK